MRDSASASFLILLASPESLSYRGLYSFEPHVGVSARLHGHGPPQLTGAVLHAARRAREAERAAGGGGAGGDAEEDALAAAAAAAAARSAWAIEGTYKFSTSGKSFAPLPTREVGLTADAVTIRRRLGGASD